MIQITDRSECSGCTACANICAHKAISMEADSLGFKYPKVNIEQCVDCGLCDKICPFNDHYSTPENFNQPFAYGARLLDEEALSLSQSGGAFMAISDIVLSEGGIIYGCGLDSAFKAKHIRVSSTRERNTLQGSKYVQSDLSDIFLNIRKDLIEGHKVLFCGTPCQTAGLNAFIPKRLRSYLTLVDLVCHGVPGPSVWEEYLKYIEYKFNDRIERAIFRNKKKFNWRKAKETYYLAKTGEIDSFEFSNLFYQNIMLRESCFNCKFSNTRRPSDITIGDFWGCEKVNSQLADDGKGVSLIYVNTPKGQELFEKVKSQMFYFPTYIESTLQPNLRRPSRRPSARTQFEKEFEQYGFQYVLKKYGPESFRYRARYILFRLMHLPIGAFNRLKRLVTK